MWFPNVLLLFCSCDFFKEVQFIKNGSCFKMHLWLFYTIFVCYNPFICPFTLRAYYQCSVAIFKIVLVPKILWSYLKLHQNSYPNMLLLNFKIPPIVFLPTLTGNLYAPKIDLAIDIFGGISLGRYSSLWFWFFFSM